MMYPLFNADYRILEKDLVASQVPCEVSSSTIGDVVVAGEPYDEKFRRKIELEHPSVDLFGENGEFHSLAKVWKVQRSVALGI
jgi:ribosome-associated toxin RatA of RatAB toxin-antitoxin module